MIIKKRYRSNGVTLITVYNGDEKFKGGLRKSTPKSKNIEISLIKADKDLKVVTHRPEKEILEEGLEAALAPIMEEYNRAL